MTAAQSNPQPNGAAESLDLAALGKTWTPPRETADTSPEVSEVITEMPWWAARGVIYIVVGFAVAALIWASLSMVDQTVAARGALVPEGYARPVQAAGAGVTQAVLVREGETVERGQPLVQLDAAEMRTRLQNLRAEIATSETQLRQLRVRAPLTESLEQQNRLARLRSEVATVETALNQTTVTAPVSGIITTLDIKGAGAVIEAGQKLLTIAPTGTRLVAEARVRNRDIAFVEPGLPVRLEFDAFPFQDYGAAEGTVIYVSPDAQTVSLPEGAGESFYKVLIELRAASINARGRNVPLRAGLTTTAEIITDRKSVLSLLLEPFNRLRGEARR